MVMLNGLKIVSMDLMSFLISVVKLILTFILRNYVLVCILLVLKMNGHVLMVNVFLLIGSVMVKIGLTVKMDLTK